MSCTERQTERLAAHESEALLDIARAALRHGLVADEPPHIAAGLLQGRLAEPAGSFVTVYYRAALRGCVGSLSATLPLGRDVARNAFQAAFRDPRFARLAADELGQTELEISILSAPESIECGSEPELHAQLVPGEDGLILIHEERRATFLPKVWEHLPEPAAFLRELKRKAGLPADYWTGTLRFARYRTSSCRGPAECRPLRAAGRAPG